MDTIEKIIRAVWPFLRAAWPVVAHSSKYGNYRLSKEKVAHLAEMLIGAATALNADWATAIDPQGLAGTLVFLWGLASAWRRDREAERDAA